MPLSKGMSFEEIVKKEVDAGKSQTQAVAIAYKTTGKENNLSWHDRMNTLDMRAARGTARYASKKNEDEVDMDKIDGQIRKDGGAEGHIDEASEEEDEIQEDEVLKKKEMTPKGNSVTFRVARNK